MQISAASLRLPILLDLLERGYTWAEISTTPSLFEYSGDIYPYENGGQGLVDKKVSFLSSFMQYVHQTLVNYMLTTPLTWQEAVDEYKNVPVWRYNAYPRAAHREYTILEMDYIHAEDMGHKNLEVVLDKFKLFFYITPEGIIKHVKKENQ